MTLCALLLNPLIKTSADLLAKQIAYEQLHTLGSEAERAFQLIGRAIRMAGYEHVQSVDRKMIQKNINHPIEVRKGGGYERTDILVIKHGLSTGTDFDCTGNVLSNDRTRNHLAMQGFLVNKSNHLLTSVKNHSGSLVCQSLDRQGRIQNTVLMNGVQKFTVEELNQSTTQGQRAFRVQLGLTNGASVQRGFERTFTTRNLP